MSERYYNGTYVGRVVALDKDKIEIVETRADGTNYSEPSDADPTLDWGFSDAAVAAEANALDVEVGEVVRVYVEFNTYTAVKVEHFTLHPRQLHERILRIEQHLGLI